MSPRTLAKIVAGVGIALADIGLCGAMVSIGWLCDSRADEWRMNPVYLIPLLPLGLILVKCAKEILTSSRQ